MTDSTINYISLWGAGLSTLLAFVKLWEIWRDRFQIDINGSFTNQLGAKNKIHIRNLSGKPIILTYWEIFFRYRFWSFKKDDYITSPEDNAFDMNINSYSSKTLNLMESDYFNWDQKGKHIYIKLHIAGRRPITKRVL